MTVALPCGVGDPGRLVVHARRPGAGHSARCGPPSISATSRRAAELLGIPYDEVMQLALIPFAHTVGTDFRPARREPLELVTPLGTAGSRDSRFFHNRDL